MHTHKKLHDLIFKKVRKIITSNTGIRNDYIALTTNLNEMGNDVDSLDIFNIITDIEEEFNIHIPETQIHTLMNVDHMVEFIAKELSSKK